MAGKKFSPLQLIRVFQSLVCQVRSPHWTPIFLAGFRNTVHARVREIWKISRVVVRDFCVAAFVAGWSAQLNYEL